MSEPNDHPIFKEMIEEMVATGTLLRLPDGSLKQNKQAVAENRARYMLDIPHLSFAQH
jgi:hypothetical protein